MRVNHSANEAAPSAVERSNIALQRKQSVWPILAASLVYPVLRFGLINNTTSILIASAAITAAYILGIYLYRAVITLASEKSTRLIIGLAATTGVIGTFVCPSEQLIVMLVETSFIFGSSLLVGIQATREKSQLRLYLWGFIVVLCGGLIIFTQQQAALSGLGTEVAQNIAEDLKVNLVASGYQPETAQEYALRAQQAFEVAVRLLPAATIMNLIVQFSIGFLWFLSLGLSENIACGRLHPMYRWKVPFWLTPVLIIAILMRLWGSDGMVAVADNGLLILSIFYCVGGLALLEYFLKRTKVRLGIKVLFYIMLVVSGIIGYFAVALAGFVDSFADWRKLSHDALNLDKTS